MHLPLTNTILVERKYNAKYFINIPFPSVECVACHCVMLMALLCSAQGTTQFVNEGK